MIMELYHSSKAVKLLCSTAKSFPAGIKEAFSTLEQHLPSCETRTWYGVSYLDDKGTIVYKAAVTELSEIESEETGFESFTVPPGTYLTETLKDWMKNTQEMGNIFDRLLADPRLDTSFPCIEHYKAYDEVVCMIKINT
jgi:predicted transcriptional regulator YdeE